jgi:hypothetical protein
MIKRATDIQIIGKTNLALLEKRETTRKKPIIMLVMPAMMMILAINTGQYLALRISFARVLSILRDQLHIIITPKIVVCS